MWELTRDWSDVAIGRWRDGWAQRKGDPFAALTVCYAESGCYARAGTFASGINQIEPGNLAPIGWHGTPESFRALSAEDQIPFVFRFFDTLRGATFATVAGIYVANFEPAYVGRAGEPSFVLCGARAGDPHPENYAPNARALDPDNKGWIQVSDLVAYANRRAKGPRFEELQARLRIAVSGAPVMAPPAVEIVGAVQEALTLEGFPLTPDGIAGPMTRHAIEGFEHAHELPVDGAIGGAFLVALAAALRVRAAKIARLADELAPAGDG